MGEGLLEEVRVRASDNGKQKTNRQQRGFWRGVVESFGGVLSRSRFLDFLQEKYQLRNEQIFREANTGGREALFNYFKRSRREGGEGDDAGALAGGRV